MRDPHTLSPIPLDSLRAFECAARHGSFKQAAAELAVTPAAVSQRVRGLEDLLGVALFDRGNRTVRLTEVGERLQSGVKAGLAVIEAAIENVAAPPSSPSSLAISVPTSFAAKWLAARLSQFSEAHPEVTLRLEASDALADLARDRRLHLAIRYGSGEYPGIDAERLPGPADLIPVCAPDLPWYAAVPRASLAAAPLLHTERPGHPGVSPGTDWDAWRIAIGLSHPARSAGVFSNVSLAIEAAVNRAGVALAPELLVLDDLAQGRLVRASTMAMPDSLAFRLCTRSGARFSQNMTQFAQWLEQAMSSCSSTAALESRGARHDPSAS